MPFELQRQFGLMRELDERAYKLQQQVDADMLTQLKAAAERQQGKCQRVAMQLWRRLSRLGSAAGCPQGPRRAPILAESTAWVPLPPPPPWPADCVCFPWHVCNGLTFLVYGLMLHAEPVQSPSKRQKAAASSAAAAERECSERIEADMNELVKLSDEKLNIATQVLRERSGCMQQLLLQLCLELCSASIAADLLARASACGHGRLAGWRAPQTPLPSAVPHHFAPASDLRLH